jgi:sigma-B regulation protein RsbU (phosphoserine phosphatase)
VSTLVAASGSTILVVDDNEVNRDLLQRRLMKGGHVVGLAEHGRQALEMLAATPFDLVMLDIMMPEMNGYEVLARLKADERLQHIPVIMITAVDDIESVVRCIELGAEDHLPKPFNPVLLRARVNASLSKKRLHDREQLYTESLARELEIGRRIQQGFLPETLPQVVGWEIDARFRPARQVAGDFYDSFVLPSGHVAVIVADVCDKGVGAALFMALFRSLLRALAEQWFADGTSEAALHATVVATNDYIARTHSSANMFATVFFGVLDPVTGHLMYVNAGHDSPFVYDQSGLVRARLEPTGPALGMMPGLPFGTSDLVLAPGEMLIAVTDGVFDTHNPEGASLGEAPFADLAANSATEALNAIVQCVDVFASGEPAYDDITMLAVRRCV